MPVQFRKSDQQMHMRNSGQAQSPGSFLLSSIHEDKPGRKWQNLFDKHWPQYKTWFLSEGQQARPGYVTSSKKLRTHMPELMPVYEQLVELAGGGDLAARFLSFYRPPPYLLGCSQAVWSSKPAALIRNYDYSPILFEWTLLRTCWLRPVIAMSDCLWGVLDGMNDAGLAASLAFGGNKKTDDGFGVPLVLRYILETCDNVNEACAVLQRVAVHMAYNIILLDRHGTFMTAYLTPERKPPFVHNRVSTNHQDRIEWSAYERMSASIERRTFLENRLANGCPTQADFIDYFLHPPIYRTRYERAFGTLYTAAYHPSTRAAEYRWPNTSPLRQSFSTFREGEKTIHLGNSQLHPRLDKIG
jgi:predicted choloylglycine hydrolase